MAKTEPAGGKRSRRRRKYKSAGDSYTTSPPMSGNFTASRERVDSGGGIGAYLQDIMQDATNLVNPKSDHNVLANLLLGEGKPMVNSKNWLEGLPKTTKAKSNPQRVAPPVTMQAIPKQQGQDAQSSSMDMLTELAMSMLTQPGASYDYESAMQEAAHGIRKAYAAEIGAIRSNNRAARKDTKKARKEIEHLYEGLARQMGKQAVRAERRGDMDAQDQMNIAGQGSDVLSQLNQQMIADESTMLQNLGLGAAAPALVSPDYDRMGGQIADMTEQGTNAASLAARSGDAQSRYMRRSQAGAQFEGADQSAELIGELQNYLRQNRDQIGILRGNRAKEIGASKASIQAQAAEMAAQQDSQTWDQVMELIDTMGDIENTNFDNKLDAREFRWDQKMDKRKLRLDQMQDRQQDAFDPMEHYDPNIKDALSIIAQTKDPNDQKALNALMQMFGSNEFRTGQVGVGNGDTVKLTVAEAMAMARKKGVAMGLQGKELNDFIMAAAASI